jgi:hypothetical protein
MSVAPGVRYLKVLRDRHSAAYFGQNYVQTGVPNLDTEVRQSRVDTA